MHPRYKVYIKIAINHHVCIKMKIMFVLKYLLFSFGWYVWVNKRTVKLLSKQIGWNSEQKMSEESLSEQKSIEHFKKSRLT